MKKWKKRSVSEESYWKTSTDIMAGVMLVILLVLMLLMLYMTQLNKEQYTKTADYDVAADNDDEGREDETHHYDHEYDEAYPEPPNDGGGGGGGGGDGEKEQTPVEVNPDKGHDKTAVFVTVVDEETGNAIKKSGTLFELYTDKSAGGLQVLHTYYPKKVEYKQYETTSSGTFYLPEKITRGTYSLHNLNAPEGYGVADDFEFTVDEALDWDEPFRVEVPMSPSKNRIFVRNVDEQTKEPVGGEIYEVYASENIATLDGTVRYKRGQKVDEIKCDKTGVGASKKLYLGKYYLVQKLASEYYAFLQEQIDTEVKLTDTAKDATIIKCQKTTIKVTLTDEFTKEPIRGAIYSVTGKENLTTNDEGAIRVTDLKKNTAYNITLAKAPTLYRYSKDPITLKVDQNGYISGVPFYATAQTAYVIRLTVDVRDIIFKNSVSNASCELVDKHNKVVDSWDAVGEPHEIDGLEPGLYSLIINDDASSKLQINVKDNGSMQSAETQMWTLWDTILIAAGAVVLALMITIILRIVRVRRRKKQHDQKENVA